LAHAPTADPSHATGPEAAHVPPLQPAHAPAAATSARPPVRASRAIGTLLRKELLVELRTFESVPGMSLFAVSTFVVFHFALNRSTVDGDLAAGVLWVTLLFAAMLGVNRLFVADAEQGGFDGFLLAPVDRSALLVAKAVTLGAYLVVLELIAVPAFALLLGAPLGHGLLGLVAVLALADVGVAAIGTLISALAVRTRARDLLGPLLSLPLLVPIVIGAARASSPLLSAGGHAGGAGGPGLRWLALLGLYDLVFGLIAYAVFDFLLED
jgi:heme exporter protein B